MLLKRKSFFIREHVGMLKLADTYDILDPETQQKIGFAKERPGVIVQILRMVTDYKQMLPTKVDIHEEENQPPVLTIKRGFTLFRSKVKVLDRDGAMIGYFKSKLFSLGGGFHVYDTDDRQIADVKGDWKGWNFRFIDAGGQEIGTVAKKWAGFAKELFTSADNYALVLNERYTGDASLLLAAALAIDTIYKER
jgi:uncharacterized protein YxjI